MRRHSRELSSVEDEEPVQALGACGADEAFGDRVRFGRADRRLDDPDAFSSEDGVEVACEFAVTVADQEANWVRSLGECPGELTGLLGDPGAAGIGCAASEVNAAAAKLDEEEHV